MDMSVYATLQFEEKGQKRALVVDFWHSCLAGFAVRDDVGRNAAARALVLDGAV